jgi:transposase InsO family protein
MTERMRFVLDVKAGISSISELCRAYGVSRETGHKWLRRWKEGGLEALRDGSRAPLHHPNALEGRLEEMIVAARGAHPKWGPKKLREVLAGSHPRESWPAVSTVGEVLKRRGLVVPRARRQRHPPSPLPEGLSLPMDANDLWAVDFKGWWRTRDGAKCHPLTLTDGATRFIVRAQVLGRPDGEQVRPVLEAAMRQWGLPRAIRSDNGPPFVSAGLGGLSALSVWWIRLGIAHERIDPGCPYQNGRHERMHATMQREVASAPGATLGHQQRLLDRWREEFNAVRPHEALAMAVPASLYGVSPRPYPARLPEAHYPSDFEVRRVYGPGWFSWFDQRIGVSPALAGERIGLRQENERWWSVWLCRQPVSWLDGWGCRLVRLGKCRPDGQPVGNDEAVSHHLPTGLGKPPGAFPQLHSHDDEW